MGDTSRSSRNQHSLDRHSLTPMQSRLDRQRFADHYKHLHSSKRLAANFLYLDLLLRSAFTILPLQTARRQVLQPLPSSTLALPLQVHLIRHFTSIFDTHNCGGCWASHKFCAGWTEGSDGTHVDRHVGGSPLLITCTLCLSSTRRQTDLKHISETVLKGLLLRS